MRFEESKLTVKGGEVIGFVAAYFLFTTVLYFMLTFLNKIPRTWTYFHVIGITLVIIITGFIIKRLLR